MFFRNNMIWLDWIQKSNKKVEIGKIRVDARDTEQYSSNTRDMIIADINSLRTDTRGRFKYATDFPVYKKRRGLVDIPDYSKYKKIYFDLENLNGVRDEDIAKRRITAYSFQYVGEYTNGHAKLIPEDEELEYIKKIVKSLNKRDQLVIGWNFEYDYNLLKNRYEYLAKRRFPSLECVMIDLMSVYSKYKLQKPYKIGVKLDKALKDAGLSGKVTYEGDLDTLYYNDPDKYVSYAEYDTVGLRLLDEKEKLTELMIELCGITNCIIHDAMYNTAIIETDAYHELKKMGKVFANKKKHNKKGFKGAKVIDPKPGLHRGVRCCDLNSLYPFIIMNWKLSPENYSPRKINDKYKETPAGTFFDQTGDDAIILHLVRKYVDGREEYRHTDETKQKVYKILANSVYGAMGTPYFRLSNVDIARTITACGRDLLLTLREYVNELYGEGDDIILYGDTDSIFIKHEEDLSDIINEHLVPLYYEERGIELGDRPFGVKDEYGVCDIIIFSIKKTYLVRKKDGTTVYKNIDKANRIKVAMDYFKFVGDCIFDGHITSLEELEQCNADFIETFELDKDYLMSYRIKKSVEEYSTRQPWMEGIENFQKIYPEYNKEYRSGSLIKIRGDRKRHKTTGKPLTTFNEYILAVPDGLDIQDTFDMFREYMSEQGEDIDINMKYYEEKLLSMIHHYNIIFDNEEE